MPIFLNLRARPSGGEVADQVSVAAVNLPPVALDPATLKAIVKPPTAAPLALSDLASRICGKNVLLATHGFNVNQQDGYQSLSNWLGLLRLDSSWVAIGVVWPGDSSWLGPLCYPGEGRHAMACGQLLAQFLFDNLAGANSLAFASHSLGARFLLETVTAHNELSPAVAIRQVVIMAGAVNYDCLTNEFAAAAQSLDRINLLAASTDEVLSKAFPAGNVFEGIIDSGHPWFEAALGHSGPKQQLSGKFTGPFQVPDAWNFGHGSYLEIKPACSPMLPLPLDVPTPNALAPYPKGFESSWVAAFVSSRLK